jgi:hypothetical protein
MMSGLIRESTGEFQGVSLMSVTSNEPVSNIINEQLEVSSNSHTNDFPVH